MFYLVFQERKNDLRKAGGRKARSNSNIKVDKKMQHALTHKSSCRLAEPIAYAERFRVGGREWLHLLGRYVVYILHPKRKRKERSDRNQSPDHATHHTIARRRWLLTSLREQRGPSSPIAGSNYRFKCY